MQTLLGKSAIKSLSRCAAPGYLGGWQALGTWKQRAKSLKSQRVPKRERHVHFPRETGVGG